MVFIQVFIYTIILTQIRYGYTRKCCIETRTTQHVDLLYTDNALPRHVLNLVTTELARQSVLCYVMLRYVTLRYVTLRYVTLCYVMLCYVIYTEKNNNILTAIGCCFFIMKSELKEK